METKILADGEAAQKTYSEFSELCEERSKQLGFDVKTGESDASDLQATIDKAVADSESFKAKIEELSSAIATAEADLKEATEIRAKEAADFAAEEKDSETTIHELSGAVSMTEHAAASGSA